MRVCLLGPVHLSTTIPIDLGAPRQRSVLAALAVDAGRLVPIETLIDRIWGDDPPRQARETLYPYITRLRRSIAEAAAADGTPAELRRQSGGYQLDMDPDRVDPLLFRRLADDGDVASLRHALDLWQGDLLAENPLMESLAEVLMRALHSAGRGAEALAAGLETPSTAADTAMTPAVTVPMTLFLMVSSVAGGSMDTMLGRRGGRFPCGNLVPDG
jgi:hypothetical protein